MSQLLVGLGLAVLASLALATAFLLQHAGALGAPPITALHPARTLRGLLRSRLWTLGLALGLIGWGLHVGALSQAPLSLVQAFSGVGIALLAPAATPALGERLGRGERAGVVLVAAGVAALATGMRAGAWTPPSSEALTAYLAAAAALAALLVGLSRATALAAAGGVLYGLGDSATKAATLVARTRGLEAALAGPWPAMLLVATVAAFFCFQRGLQTGPAVPTIALMIAATNVVSILCGLVVFGDPLGGTPALVALHLAGFALVGVASWLLAPAQARLGGTRPKEPWPAERARLPGPLLTTVRRGDARGDI